MTKNGKENRPMTDQERAAWNALIDMLNRGAGKEFYSGTFWKDEEKVSGYHLYRTGERRPNRDSFAVWFASTLKHKDNVADGFEPLDEGLIRNVFDGLKKLAEPYWAPEVVVEEKKVSALDRIEALENRADRAAKQRASHQQNLDSLNTQMQAMIAWWREQQKTEEGMLVRMAEIERQVDDNHSDISYYANR